jgi:hypothetical protein
VLDSFTLILKMGVNIGERENTVLVLVERVTLLLYVVSKATLISSAWLFCWSHVIAESYED